MGIFFLWSGDTTTDIFCEDCFQGVDNTVYVEVYNGVWAPFFAGCRHFVRVWLLRSVVIFVGCSHYGKCGHFLWSVDIMVNVDIFCRVHI